MLLWRDVAEHIGPEPADHRRPDCARDVIISRRDVSYKRTEGIEWRLVADLFHAPDVHLDLVHRNVSGAFDHYLYISLPCSPGELSQRVELRELGAVAGVGNTSRSQAVAQ